MVKRVALFVCLVVIVACGGSSSDGGQATRPLINSLLPSSSVVGDPGFDLSVQGSGFSPTSSVKWNGASRATAYVDATKLTATILAGDLATAGNFSVTVTDSTGTSNSVAFAVQPPPFDGARYVGTYLGSWTNTTFGTSGASSLVITADAVNKTGTARWDLDGNVLGQTNPPAETFNGTYTNDGFTFGGSSATFGTFEISVGRNGQATGSATNIPNTAIQSVSFTGTATQTAINLNYTVRFSAAGGGGTATGTVSMTKQ